MFGLGFGEIAIIAIFALLFIGPKKLPELARGLGKGLREFQKAKDDIMIDVKEDLDLEDLKMKKEKEKEKRKEKEKDQV